MHASPPQAVDHNAMTFGEHLEELRRRLIVALLGLLPIILLALVFGKPLLSFMVRPAEAALLAQGLPPMLQATGPLETFGSYLRISLAVAIVVGSPWLLWQFWIFVTPGLYERERRFVYVLAPLSALLTVLGAVFLYTVMLPIVLAFFIGFGTSVGARDVPTAAVPDGVTLQDVPVLGADPPAPERGQAWINERIMELRVAIGTGPKGEPIIAGSPLHKVTGILQQYRISEYTKLVLALAIAFVIGFQTPVVVLLLGWAGIIDTDFLDGKRRYVAMGCLVAGAVLTPADPLSMVAMAVPLYLLFELGILLMRWLPAERVARGFGPREGPDAGDE